MLPINTALMAPEALGILAAGIIIGLWIKDKWEDRRNRRKERGK